MLSFIDTHREEYGVEPICAVLPIAPSTYYAQKEAQPQQRAVRDKQLCVEISRAWNENQQVYGAKIVWSS